MSVFGDTDTWQVVCNIWCYRTKQVTRALKQPKAKAAPQEAEPCGTAHLHPELPSSSSSEPFCSPRHTHSPGKSVSAAHVTLGSAELRQELGAQPVCKLPGLYSTGSLLTASQSTG